MWPRRLILTSSNQKEVAELWFLFVAVIISVIGVFRIKIPAKPAEIITPLGEFQPTVPVTVVEDQEPTETPVVKKKLASILILGDSMIVEGFGPRLTNDLSVFVDLKVVRRGKYSTGLNRIDVFDWYKNSKELILEFKPEVLVVMFGANDSQNILDKQGNPFGLGDSEWDGVYLQRVSDYMILISPMVEKIYWVGQPAAREMVFSLRLKHLNQMYEDTAGKFPNIRFVSTWERFTKEGKYQVLVADEEGVSKRVKTDDGIHMTDHGSKIMSQLVIEQIKSDYELDLK